jgi:D-alanine-D-alanine ligase
VPTIPTAGSVSEGLRELERRLVARADDLALLLVYDRPQRVDERPGLARAFFAQRCVSDAQLAQTTDAFRSVGAYVELFEGERSLLEALTSGRLRSLHRRLQVVYNGIEGGICVGGFEPGRKALLPAIADSYGLVCSNSNAYACALGRHKFHYFTVLKALGVPTPDVWHYRPSLGWAGGAAPPAGIKVIAKSTFESWSVGVTEDSIFVVDESCEERVAVIAEGIGQAVTVQEFISGKEICVPVLSYPERVVTPPMQAILAKAPGDVNAVMTVDDNLRRGGVSHSPFCGSADVETQLYEYALASFDALELRAFARIDFRVDEAERVWAIDVGVSPGIGEKSSAYKSLRELGFDHPSFLRVVVAATLASRGLL